MRALGFDEARMGRTWTGMIVGRSTPGEKIDKIVILPTQRCVRTCRFLRRL